MATNKMNRIATAIRVLNERKVGFARLSDIHFRIRNVDFWPTTGRFYDRRTFVKGRGLEELLEHLDGKFTAQSRQTSWDKFFGPKPVRTWKPIIGKPRWKP